MMCWSKRPAGWRASGCCFTTKSEHRYSWPGTELAEEIIDVAKPPAFAGGGSVLAETLSAGAAGDT